MPSSRPLIVFRVDASLEIGTGHVMRCLTLANRLQMNGARCAFFCRHAPPAIAAEITNRKHQLYALTSAPAADAPSVATEHASWLATSQKADSSECLDVLRTLEDKPSWLVVDHYGLGAEWERSLRPHVGRIFVIDDLANRPHECDALLDQNFHSDAATRYRGRVAPACNLLLGPRYALLRPEFMEARPGSARRNGAVKRLLVSMGGIDHDNDTLRAIHAFLALERSDLLLDVIVSGTNPHLRTLSDLCRGQPSIILHEAPTNIAQLMSYADLALGAGGISTWERCCLGLPTVVIAIATNQKPGCEALARYGAILYLGTREQASTSMLSAALLTLLQSPGLLHSMAAKGTALVDGMGAERVARMLLAPELQLRSATDADSASIFTWRNHEDTRRHSADPKLIAASEHKRWLEAVLADPSRRILIAEQEGQPVGVLRYDLTDEEALVSVYLVPGNSGRGLGPRLLAAGERWLAGEWQSVQRIRAHVQHDNVASMRAFEAAGFKRESVDFLKVVDRHGD